MKMVIIFFILFLGIFCKLRQKDIVKLTIFKSGNESLLSEEVFENYYLNVEDVLFRGLSRFSFNEKLEIGGGDKSHGYNSALAMSLVDVNVLEMYKSNEEIKEMYEKVLLPLGEDGIIDVEFAGRCELKNKERSDDYQGEDEVCFKYDVDEIVQHIHLFNLLPEDLKTNLRVVTSQGCSLQEIENVFEVYAGKITDNDDFNAAIMVTVKDEEALISVLNDPIFREVHTAISELLDTSSSYVELDINIKGVHCNYFSTDPANAGIAIVLGIFLTIVMAFVIIVLGLNEVSRL